MTFDLEGYLSSSDFNGLCIAMDFLDEDTAEIKRKARELKGDVSEGVAIAIYEQMLKYLEPPSREIYPSYRYYRWLSDDEWLSRGELFYQVFIRDNDRWEDIHGKLKAGVASGKISSDYLFEKEFSHELDQINVSKHKNALNAIYLHEIHYLLDKCRIPGDLKKQIFKDACMNGEFYADPLRFNELKRKVDRKVRQFSKNPCIRIRDISRDTLWVSYLLIEDATLVEFIDDYIAGIDEGYNGDSSEYIFAYPSFMGTEMVFYVLTCGGDSGYKHRLDFSNIYIIKRSLTDDSRGIIVNQNSGLAKRFEEYIDSSFRASHNLHLKEDSTVEHDDLKITRFTNPDDGKTWHIFDSLGVNENFEAERPLSEDLYSLASSLNMDIDEAHELLKYGDNMSSVLKATYIRMLEDCHSDETLQVEELKGLLVEFKVKSILQSRRQQWIMLEKKLLDEIDSGKIRTRDDLERRFNRIIGRTLKTEILYAQIRALIDFRELDDSWAEKMAEYLKDKDILDNKLGEHVNELILAETRIKEKEYCDEGKYAAPRWLVYPELDPYTIGWRMGYGEAYAMNEPWPDEEFKKLFPRPQNWLFDRMNHEFKKFPLMGYFWRENGKPKYEEITNDAINVEDFITVDGFDGKFQYNAFMLKSIEHGILLAKYTLFEKVDPNHVSFNTLKRGFELSDDDIAYWQNFRYTVLLNATYYKFMQNDDLKEWLLSTGDKCLVYNHDDEWADDNLFGFALMELRDEIRRLLENEDLIDWEYTEYLKHCDPYE